MTRTAYTIQAMDDQKPSQKPDDKNPERERKVREKLRELYGDDTPESGPG